MVHRIEINTEEKAKVVASVWGTEFIQFYATLGCLSFSTIILFCQTLFKVIVSRDWGGLQMILLDRLEVFNISVSGFFKILLPFYTVILKMAA